MANMDNCILEEMNDLKNDIWYKPVISKMLQVSLIQ